MTTSSQGTVDPLDFSAVFERETQAGPKVTFYVPTDATGAKADISALTLKNQLREAHTRLTEAGASAPEADEMLAPVSELVDDSSYWRLQSRGLVVFVDRGFHSALRVPIEVRASVAVGERFNVLPLAPVLAIDRRCYILALAKNSVRLFDATRNSVAQLPLENIPESFEDVVGELPEQYTQFRPTRGGAGTGGVAFGHSGASDTETMLTEKYIHAVAKAVGERLGTARSQPLVLAAVAEHLTPFRSACPYPAVHDGVVAGNPEHTLPDELRSAAWRLLHDSENAREAEEQERARSLAHNGKGSFDLGEIAKAAEEGRVETLYLPRDDQRINTGDARELANRALLGTIGASGAVRTLEAVDGEGALATFRY